MISKKQFSVTAFLLLLGCFFVHAQYGNNGRYGNNNRYGRQRSNIPQAQAAPKEVKPKTAAEIVESQMPLIKEHIELSVFEDAVVSSVLTRYIQEKMNVLIMELGPEKNKEQFKKINEQQNQELKNGLPEDKYKSLAEFIEKGEKKFLKERKKKNKKKNKKKKEEE